MDRRGFFARAAAAIAAILAACVGTGTPSFAAPAPAPRSTIDGPSYEDVVGGIDVDDIADYVSNAEEFARLDAARAPWIGPPGTHALDRPKFTLRSWRAMTHPQTATAEERRLARVPWASHAYQPLGIVEYDL